MSSWWSCADSICILITHYELDVAEERAQLLQTVLSADCPRLVVFDHSSHGLDIETLQWLRQPLVLCVREHAVQDAEKTGEILFLASVELKKISPQFMNFITNCLLTDDTSSHDIISLIFFVSSF